MQNGILELSTGRFYPLNSRADFKSRELQEVLMRNHKQPNALSCGCGMNDGVFHHIISRIIPAAAGGSRTFTAVRQEIDKHESGCFLMQEGDDEESERVRSTNILV